MITFQSKKSYEERSARLNLFSLNKGRLEGKLNECFKIFKGITNVDASKLFSIDNSSLTRSNSVKLRCKQVQLDSAKFFFTNNVVWKWNKFPPSLVQSDSINSFKNKLDHCLLSHGMDKQRWASVFFLCVPAFSSTYAPQFKKRNHAGTQSFQKNAS